MQYFFLFLTQWHDRTFKFTVPILILVIMKSRRLHVAFLLHRIIIIILLLRLLVIQSYLYVTIVDNPTRVEPYPSDRDNFSWHPLFAIQSPCPSPTLISCHMFPSLSPSAWNWLAANPCFSASSVRCGRFKSDPLVSWSINYSGILIQHRLMPTPQEWYTNVRNRIDIIIMNCILYLTRWIIICFLSAAFVRWLSRPWPPFRLIRSAVRWIVHLRS